MGKTVRLRGYLSKGQGSAVKSAKTDPSPTKAEYNSWVKTAITQIWLLMDGAWKEKHAVLHNGKNNTVSQSEYNEKIAVLESGYAEYLEQKYNTMSEVMGVQIPVRMTDFKVIENIILKKNAYSELAKMAEIGNVNYPKAMLGEYELGLMYEKQGDPKHASKKYQNASQMEPIGDLNKDLMYEKIDEMNTLAKKSK